LASGGKLRITWMALLMSLRGTVCVTSFCPIT